MTPGLDRMQRGKIVQKLRHFGREKSPSAAVSESHTAKFCCYFNIYGTVMGHWDWGKHTVTASNMATRNWCH